MHKTTTCACFGCFIAISRAACALMALAICSDYVHERKIGNMLHRNLGCKRLLHTSQTPCICGSRVCPSELLHSSRAGSGRFNFSCFTVRSGSFLYGRLYACLPHLCTMNIAAPLLLERCRARLKAKMYRLYYICCGR